MRPQRQRLERCSYTPRDPKDCQLPPELGKRQDLLQGSGEPGPAHTWILNFQPPELRDNPLKCFLFVCFCFLGLNPQQMEVPRQGVKWEL